MSDGWKFENGFYSFQSWSALLVSASATFEGERRMPSIEYSFPVYAMRLTARIRNGGVAAGTIEATSNIPAILDWHSTELFECFKMSSACWMDAQMLECEAQQDDFAIEQLRQEQESGNTPGLFARELVRRNSPNFAKAVNTLVIHRAALR